MKYQSIPVIRIFDESLARDFYLGFLGMSEDWAHRFDEDAPLYMQVSKGELVFHLTEHAGDCSPGSKTFVHVDQLDELHSEIVARPYKLNRPAIESAPWGGRCFTVTDPFSNRILFNQSDS